MKRLFIKTICFLLLLALLDFLVGRTCRCMQHHAGGKTGRLEFIVDSLTDDILIFGSSRALHHYNPAVVQDSLGLSCYNCGTSGNGIICNYALYHLLSARYTPKVIVYDIEPAYDFAVEKDNTKYLSNLKRYYDRPGIDSVFWSVDRMARYKMLSQMYRYNSDFIKIFSDVIHPLQSYQKGFDPKKDILQYEPDEKKDAVLQDVDSLKLYYWHKLIAECRQNGTTLIFMRSPSYKATAEQPFIKDFAAKEEIPYFSYYTDPAFVLNRPLFEDPVHMNEDGAIAYTKAIIPRIP